MHYFRAFAIFCIFFTHFTGSFGYEFVKHVFFRSSTIYFLLISGYLCQYLALKRNTIPLVYYKTKLLNVISPYVIWTILFFLIAQVDTTCHSGMNSIVYGGGFRVFVKALVSGDLSSHLWYIPFVSVLFLISPLILRMSNPLLLLVTFVAGFFYLLFPCRTGLSLNPVVSFGLYCHFTVFYLLGFLYARFKSVCDPFFKRYWFVFLVLWMVCVVRLAFKWELPSCMQLMVEDTAITLQKLFFSVIAILVFDMIRNKRIVFLDAMARYSFTIYFIHYYFISDALLFRQKFISCWIPQQLIFIADFGLALAYIAILLGVSVLLKKSLGARSRCFIGA